ncbi:helix-turn-helix transcriptional regulator [Kibdelosporangium philippinense]|uniref:Helix-turn-helix transcriptional regulator n=1 Tax=Kibdelosporangium philippinense TaxID=211113 RepID=A0ABS8ZRQ5_9PSEU|nr:helix-turn-helix domain-containing protein [Kibdelosporangium philippinense]MCE7010411.1 helix-turn-helix transcriptional regulator [Kibdelosporangium philippinense]
MSTRQIPPVLNETSCRGFETAIEAISKPWTGAVLHVLALGVRRFGEIAAMIDGISHRLLSQRLKEFTAEGLVERTVVPATPVELTGSGKDLIVALQPLVRWGAERTGSR